MAYGRLIIVLALSHHSEIKSNWAIERWINRDRDRESLTKSFPPWYIALIIILWICFCIKYNSYLIDFYRNWQLAQAYLGGGFGFPLDDFSTQHLMFRAGHWISSKTLSHIRDAKAWIHFPGHPSALAVLVTDPRNPIKIRIIDDTWQSAYFQKILLFIKHFSLVYFVGKIAQKKE